MNKLISNDSERNILLISYYCPTKYHAGGLRVLDIYAMLRRIYSSSTINLYTIKRPEIDGGYSDLEGIFNRVFFSKNELLNLDELIELQGETINYDVVDLQFHEAALDLDNFRTITRKILFTPMELLLRSLLLELKRYFYSPTDFKKSTLLGFAKIAFTEIKLARKTDVTVCVSTEDAKALKRFSLARNIVGLETGLSHYEFSVELSKGYSPVSVEEKENTILYLAYFGSQTNIDALIWYLENVHPIVKKNIPDYQFLVVGRGDLAVFQKYQDENIEFIGEVNELSPVIDRAKVGIAPALGGSGFRGKVNQYAICGVPCVASPVAANGLAYRDGEDIFVERNALGFAKRCISLLGDNELNETMRNSSRNTCMNNYTWESKREEIQKIYGNGE